MVVEGELLIPDEPPVLDWTLKELLVLDEPPVLDELVGAGVGSCLCVGADVWDSLCVVVKGCFGVIIEVIFGTSDGSCVTGYVKSDIYKEELNECEFGK